MDNLILVLKVTYSTFLHNVSKISEVDRLVSVCLFPVWSVSPPYLRLIVSNIRGLLVCLYMSASLCYRIRIVIICPRIFRKDVKIAVKVIWRNFFPSNYQVVPNVKSININYGQGFYLLLMSYPFFPSNIYIYITFY